MNRAENTAATARTHELEDRLLELYPARWANLLVLLEQREKRPIESGWNAAAMGRWEANGDPGPRLAEVVAHLEQGGNLGLAAPPGFVVLDADNARSAAWLSEAMPDAPRQRTAKGAHFVARLPAGVTLSQTVKLALGDGVSCDLRTAGRGQIACEPSIHPTGFLYTWEIELPLDPEMVPMLPAGLVERITGRHEQPSSGDGTGWGEGHRNDRLFARGCELRRAGLGETEIRGALLSLNRERCRPPLPDTEVARTAASAAGEPNAEGEETTAEAPRYRLVRLSAVEPCVDSQYLIKGLLDRDSKSVMYGPSGCSKTFVALELSIAIAAAIPWRGLRTRRGRVGYIAAEGAQGIANRLVAIKKTMALGNLDVVEFYLISSVVKLVEDDSDVPSFIASVRAQVPAGGLDLVVIDTLSRSIAGRNENSSEDMTAAVEAADRLRDELGCAVLIVHHSGKNEAAGARGHSSLRASLETELEVKPMGDIFSVTCTKQREHEQGQAFFHRLEPVEIGVDADGEPVTTCIIRPLDSPENVGIPRLNRNEQRTHRAILKILDGSAGTTLDGPDAVLRADLIQCVEQSEGVSRKLRRGVVQKGLEGLKRKGIVETNGDRVYLLREGNPS